MAKLFASVGLFLAGLCALGWSIFDVLVLRHVHGPGTYIFTAGLFVLFVGFMCALKTCERMGSRERRWSMTTVWVLIGLCVFAMGLEELGVRVFSTGSAPAWTPGPDDETRGLCIMLAGALVVISSLVWPLLRERPVSVAEETQS